ncbi:FAD:protein FMN transferase [Isosphaeraceae bacterium EP7]
MIGRNRAAYAAAIAAGLLLLGWAASTAIARGGLIRFEFVETHMGSPFHLVLYTEDEASARSSSAKAFARIAELDLALSDYNPESELMRLCGRAGGGPVSVSADLFDVLRRSLVFAECSDGAFDPTVAPVVRLWRRARRERKMPDPARLAEARALVGWRDVVLDAKARTVTLRKPGMKLDLGGIAKGLASQAAVDVLRREGVPIALCAGSGDIVVGDAPPGKAGWDIGLSPLEGDPTHPSHRVVLKNAAVSSSGDAEQFVVIDGRRYSHIVDPRTGLGVVDRCGVTVVAGDGATADGLDTAIFVMGPERGLALAEEMTGAGALVVRATPDGRKIWQSSRFDALAPPSSDREKRPSDANRAGPQDLR